MCKTCPIMSRVRVPARGSVCRGLPGPSLCPAPSMEGLPCSRWALLRSLCAMLFPSQHNSEVSALLSLTRFAVYLLHWTACVAQFSCCGRAPKYINDCCSSSRSSPCTCTFEDGATVKSISGSPELLSNSLWGHELEGERFLYLGKKKYRKRRISCSDCMRGLRKGAGFKIYVFQAVNFSVPVGWCTSLGHQLEQYF